MISGGSISLIAQPIQHNFISFSPREGLPSSDISSLFQDSRNYVWIGHAAGVSRYDGRLFQNFLFAGNDRLGRVYSVREDGEGYIWIAAEGGLFFYADQKMHFIQFEKAFPVYYLYKTDSGALWMATSEGPSYLSQTKAL
jgi:ligand-binding sensor domain-containing protein